MSLALPARVAGRRAVVAATTVLLGAAAVVSLPSAAHAGGSDAPFTNQAPALDTSGTFAFVSPDKADTVTLIGTSWPMQEAGGGPVFYPFATNVAHDLDVDQDGDGVPDLVYRFVFSSTRTGDSILYDNGPVTSLDDANLLFRQTYSLSVLTRDSRGRFQSKTLASGLPVAPSDTGPASMPDYGALRDQAVRTTGTGATAVVSYAGAADDPTFADQRLYDLLYGGNLSEVGQDTYAARNTHAIALQLPKSALALKGDPTRNPVIGVWSSISVLGAQISRVANPRVNDLLLPFSLKDRYDAAAPAGDATLIGPTIADPELPRLIQAIYGIPAPRAPRDDLNEIYLTGIAKNAKAGPGGTTPIQADLNGPVLNKDVDPTTVRSADELRLNMGVAPAAVPNRLGVLGGDLQGYPNGRRPADDVLDITLQMAEGAYSRGLPPVIVAPLAAGDRVNNNVQAFGTTFPYLALPASGNSTATISMSASANHGASAGSWSSPTVLALLLLAATIAMRPLLGLGRRLRRSRMG